MDVDDRFVDVKFDEEERYTAGMLTEVAYETFGAYEDVMPEMSWSEIDAAIDAMDENDSGAEWFVKHILDQGQEGSCVANACTQAHLILQARQFGLDRVTELTPMSLYKQIATSAQGGALVSDGLEAMCSKGLLPLDTPVNRDLFGSAVMPATGFRERYPADWELTASRFAGVAWDTVRTLRGLYTALVNRLPVIVGREGHSICYVRPRRKGNSRTVDYANSWSLDWGFAQGNVTGGWGRDTARQVDKSAKYCFVLRSVKSPHLEAA